MEPILRSDKMTHVHSDLRGPLYWETQKMAARGIEVLRLNTGNPAAFGFAMPQSVRKALLAQADRAVAYCDFRGMEEARESLLNYHKSKGLQNITADDIYIGNGVSEMATDAVLALMSAGDELLVPVPSYSLWSNSAYIAGGKPVFYRCDEQADWYPDLDDMRRKITSKTRGIVIINPNNPTGAVYPRQLLEDIAQIAREHNLVLFSDEIYDRLLLDGVEHISIAALAPDLPVITFNGLSKSHIICGFRCGWMVISGPRALTKDFDAAIVQLTAMRLCGNALTQLVIPAAMADTASTQAMLVPGGRLYEQRRVTVEGLRNIPGISVVENHAAFYIFPKMDLSVYHIKDDKQFAFDLLAQKHILLIPGSGFDCTEPDHFRLVMLPEPPAMAKAVADIGDFLAGYSQY